MTMVESLPRCAEAEALARRNGVNLTDMISEWMAEYIEDCEDSAALREAVANDDGTRYTSAELRREVYKR